MDIKGKKINFLGDSITQAVGTSNINNVYWKLLEKNDGCISFGYGISGTRIAKQQNPSTDQSFDAYFRSRIDEMEKDADVIVVFGGTNDYGHGDAAIGDFSDREDNTFYGALHNLYSDLMVKYPKAQIVVMTPCHRVDENRVYNDIGIRNVGSLLDYVKAIKEVAEYYSIPVLDLYSISGIQPELEKNREIYMPDGLHPSDEGNKLIYLRLSNYLKSL